MTVFSGKTNTRLLWFTACILLLTAGCLYYLKKPNTLPTYQNKTLSPLHCRGTYDFIISAPKDSQTFITEGSIIPCDPKKQALQEITLTTHPETTSVEGYITTDTKTTQVIFIKTPTTPPKWRGTWVNDDTYDHTYTIMVIGDYLGKKQHIPITFR